MKMAIPVLVSAIAVTNIGANCNTPPTIPPSTVTDSTSGLDAAVCALNHYATDAASGMQWPAIVTDIIVACGIPEAKVIGLLDAHRGAMVKEGYILRPIPGKDGGI
jgi:hypothetical protein